MATSTIVSRYDFYAGMGLGMCDILVCALELSVSVQSQMTAIAMINYYLCQYLRLVVSVYVASSFSRAVFERCLSQEIPLREDIPQVCVQILLGALFLI